MATFSILPSIASSTAPSPNAVPPSPAEAILREIDERTALLRTMFWQVSGDEAAARAACSTSDAALRQATAAVATLQTTVDSLLGQLAAAQGREHHEHAAATEQKRVAQQQADALERLKVDAAQLSANHNATKELLEKELRAGKVLREQVAKGAADLVLLHKAAEQTAADAKELQRRMTAATASSSAASKTHAADMQALRAELDAANKELRAKCLLVDRSEAAVKKVKTDFAVELKAQAVALNATIQELLGAKDAMAQEISRLELRVAQLAVPPRAADAKAPVDARAAVDFDDAKMRLLIKQNKAEKRRLSDIQQHNAAV